MIFCSSVQADREAQQVAAGKDRPPSPTSLAGTGLRRSSSKAEQAICNGQAVGSIPTFGFDEKKDGKKEGPMRNYEPAKQTLQWHTLTPGNMPPDKDFLLWMGVTDADGGFFTAARYVHETATGKPLYIIAIRGAGNRIVDENQYYDCRWATVPPPQCVRRKRIQADVAEMANARAAMDNA